jgi:suppressor for copper-sensitivity B
MIEGLRIEPIDRDVVRGSRSFPRERSGIVTRRPGRSRGSWASPAGRAWPFILAAVLAQAVGLSVPSATLAADRAGLASAGGGSTADGAGPLGGGLGAKVGTAVGPTIGLGDPLAFLREETAGPVALTAVVEPGAAGGPDVLAITATIEPGWHFYSLTQRPGGPLATRIEIASDAPRRIAGGFVPEPPPQKHTVEDIPAWKGLVVEEHAGAVTWRAPLTPGGGDGPVRGTVTLQLCRDNACLPPETIEFTAVAAAGVAAGVGHRPERAHATTTAQVRPVRVTADGPVLPVVITIEPEDGWHAYAPSSRGTSGVGEGRPTIVALDQTDGTGPVVRSVVATRAVTSAAAELAAAGGVDGAVVLEVGLDPASVTGPFDLLVGLQTCTETTCDPPAGVRLSVQPGADGQPPGLSFADARYAEAARAPLPVTFAAAMAPGATATADGGVSAALPAVPRAGGLTLPLALLMGLAGGLILNLMPCVLPVLGLKLMSFAQQSGRARREVFETNLWYCAGLFAVFFVLATASVAANIGLGSANLAWGEQFTSAGFNITMAGIVFAFALSFLGVWELPIPGFIGEQAGHVQTREGPMGSFLKGVLSTVLATPCSGPFLGPVLGFTLTQPTVVTYAVFGAIATGMALPYILVGIFPGLVRFMPKPGAWMTTFKEVLGFVMLGTVAFLFTFLPSAWFVPTFVMLIGIWMACWWVGRAQERTGAVGFGRWVQAAMIGTAVGTASFMLLGPVRPVIEWETPFSRARVADLHRQGHTVLVDFSADWCLTCKANLRFAIETSRVRDAIERNKVVPVLADWTEPSDEIKLALESLGSKSIPVLAIFPAGKPGEPLPEPIVLRDLLSEAQVLAAIEEAGPSCCPPPEIRAASAPGRSGR